MNKNARMHAHTQIRLDCGAHIQTHITQHTHIYSIVSACTECDKVRNQKLNETNPMNGWIDECTDEWLNGNHVHCFSCVHQFLHFISVYMCVSVSVYFCDDDYNSFYNSVFHNRWILLYVLFLVCSLLL